MNSELLGECAICELPVLEFEDWRLEKDELIHEECCKDGEN